MDKILEVLDLSAGYERGPVIEKVNFFLKPGDFVVLVGPNASGKSTLLKAILRINRIYKGRVLLEGRDIFLLPRRQIAREVAYLPQENGHEFPFNLEEVVGMGRFPHSPLFFDTPTDREKIEEALKQVGLWEKRKEKFGNLSGGEKRRGVIARALAQGSKVLLLDEPTLHLDLNFQLEVSSLLKDLSRSGIAVLAVYHDLWLPRLFARRILAMKSGKLVKELTPEEVTPYFVSQLYGIEPSLFPSFSLGKKGDFLW
ncbi:MAG: ABC transporter ATP-binding protein [Caldiserica bacterium]|jgi:iron complex transport system ATP-binding protein|nr:ABC transporter ATP-binding protein [Caldisericota bacterium]MDH7562697.1 ABC transporter ATP-binding protein [Caldisericota bacterium]